MLLFIIVMNDMLSCTPLSCAKPSVQFKLNESIAAETASLGTREPFAAGPPPEGFGADCYPALDNFVP